MTSTGSRRSTNASDDPYSVPGAFPDPADSISSTQQSLAQAVYARRNEYTKPRKIRIKIGSWNVGNHDCARDIEAWFAEGKGIDEHFGRLNLSTTEDLKQAEKSKSQNGDEQETVNHQEARQATLPATQPTVPERDKSQLPADEEIGLYVLGLQEIVDVGSPAEALRPYTDPTPANKYKDFVRQALPNGYVLIAEQQLIGLLLIIYASPSVANDVQSATTTSVGTGLMGYMGNKGAVTAHIILGETTRLLFVNCHLAAGSDKASGDRRNWDAGQIMTRTKFDKIKDPSGLPNSGESIGDEDFAFWFGDLNYRLADIPGDDVRRLLTLHTRNEYDLRIAEERKRLEEEGKTQSPDGDVDSTKESDAASTVSTETSSTKNSSKFSQWQEGHFEVPDDLDPASLQTTLTSLLPHDELAQQIRLRKAFSEGWREGPIRFLPTYKYDTGTVAVFDSSEKKRSPSWCDRILYRTRNEYLEWKRQIAEEEAAKKKDDEMKARGIEEDENVIFDYNPEEDGDEMFDHTDFHVKRVKTRDGSEDEIALEYYTSHQRVLSSDHKPIDAIFGLTYRGVDQDLRAKVHSEVTKILDRNENEGRPTVTVIIENFGKDASTDDLSNTENTEGMINFGKVQYGKGKHRSITVANTGQVPAVISLVERPVSGLGEEGPTPPWLLTQFDREPDTRDKKSKEKSDGPAYTLQPGDVCNIEFVARVEAMDLAKDLNDGVLKLDDVLILRVRDGRDHFLPVTGHWVKSSLDRAADALKRLPEESMRKLQHQKPEGTSKIGFSLFRKSEG